MDFARPKAIRSGLVCIALSGLSAAPAWATDNPADPHVVVVVDTHVDWVDVVTGDRTVLLQAGAPIESAMVVPTGGLVVQTWDGTQYRHWWLAAPGGTPVSWFDYQPPETTYEGEGYDELATIWSLSELGLAGTVPCVRVLRSVHDDGEDFTLSEDTVETHGVDVTTGAPTAPADAVCSPPRETLMSLEHCSDPAEVFSASDAGWSMTRGDGTTLVLNTGDPSWRYWAEEEGVTVTKACVGADHVIAWVSAGTSGSMAEMFRFGADGTLIESMGYDSGRADPFFGSIPAGYTSDAQFLVWLGDRENLVFWGADGVGLRVPANLAAMPLYYLPGGQPFPGP